MLSSPIFPRCGGKERRLSLFSSNNERLRDLASLTFNTGGTLFLRSPGCRPSLSGERSYFQRWDSFTTGDFHSHVPADVCVCVWWLWMCAWDRDTLHKQHSILVEIPSTVCITTKFLSILLKSRTKYILGYTCLHFVFIHSCMQTCPLFTVFSSFTVFVIEIQQFRVLVILQYLSFTLALSVATHIKHGSLSLFSLCHQLFNGHWALMWIGRCYCLQHVLIGVHWLVSIFNYSCVLLQCGWVLCQRKSQRNTQ